MVPFLFISGVGEICGGMANFGLWTFIHFLPQWWTFKPAWCLVSLKKTKQTKHSNFLTTDYHRFQRFNPFKTFNPSKKGTQLGTAGGSKKSFARLKRSSLERCVFREDPSDPHADYGWCQCALETVWRRDSPFGSLLISTLNCRPPQARGAKAWYLYQHTFPRARMLRNEDGLRLLQGFWPTWSRKSPRLIYS